MRATLDCVSAFLAAINKSLKMGVNRGSQITVNFRTDVFQFLFKDKGREYPHGPGQLFELEDFDKNFFLPDWHRVHDHLGDGCEIQFPLRLRSRVKWAQATFLRDDQSDILRPKKKKFV